MSTVNFKFTHPDGTPVVDTAFLISLRKSSFDEATSGGIVVPGDVTGLTDANGEASVELAHSMQVYYLTMALPGEDAICPSGLRYRFIVPVGAGPFRVEDLIVTTPTWSRPWDEVALQVIIDAKLETKASAESAKESELAAAESANVAEQAAIRADTSAQVSADNADATSQDRVAAEQASTQAQASATSAEQNAQAVVAALASALEAKDTAVAAAVNAGNAAIATGQDKDAAAASAVAAANSATASSGFAQTAEGAESVATAKAGEASASASAALDAQVAAEAALAALEPQMAEMGNVSLASGEYPPKTPTGALWRVSEGGTVDGVIFTVGNALVYSKVDDIFYRLGSSEGSGSAGVLTVNGRDGDVTLVKGDVGLANVNNTSDANKPVSTAQQTALNNKVDKEAGKGLSPEEFTSAEKTKLAGLESSHFRGSFVSLAALTSAVTDAAPGDYADVDAGAGSPAVRYIWDDSDTEWVASGAVDPITASQVKTLYEANPDTNNFSDADKTKLDGIAAGATANQTDTFLRNRANHTGTQLAATISDFAEAVEALVDGGTGQATVTFYKFNLTTGQTVISGNDINGNTLAYTPGSVMLFNVGEKLRNVDDFTATNGTSITLTAALESDGQLDVIAFGSFDVANTYTKAEVDAKTGFSGAYIGQTIAWKLSEASIPSGCLPENGQLVNRATYPDLWALYAPIAVTDAVWLASPYLNRGLPSSGDGSTTFRMPDTNGKHADGNTPAAAFLRGYGKNSAGTPGLFQLDQSQGHEHGATSASSNPFPLTAPSGTGPNVSGWYFSSGFAARTGPQVASSGIITDGTNGTPRVGNETRPVSAAVIWCTVAAKNATNFGSVDVMALAGSVTALESTKQTKPTRTAELAITNGGAAFTIAHGMNPPPTDFNGYVVCKVAEGGFNVGELVKFSARLVNSSNVDIGMQISADATNVTVRQPTTYGLQNKSTGAGFALTLASWRAIIEYRP